MIKRSTRSIDRSLARSYIYIRLREENRDEISLLVYIYIYIYDYLCIIYYYFNITLFDTTTLLEYWYSMNENAKLLLLLLLLWLLWLLVSFFWLPNTNVSKSRPCSMSIGKSPCRFMFYRSQCVNGMEDTSFTLDRLISFMESGVYKPRKKSHTD